MSYIEEDWKTLKAKVAKISAYDCETHEIADALQALVSFIDRWMV